MSDLRYFLEKYTGVKSRHTCPKCGERATFTLYIDSNSNKSVSDLVGRCNREVNCGYHLTPKEYFQRNGIISAVTPFIRREQPKLKHTSYIDPGAVDKSFKAYDQNNLVKFLNRVFSVEVVSEVISRYRIGTSKHWRGSTVFWLTDIDGRVRSGKIMLYDANTGKRVKHPFNHVDWAHKILELPGFELRQCLFGEHLLRDNIKPVGIVESEKTALIASVCYPDYIWLATGGLSNLTYDKCKVIHGRKVVLFPDLGAFDLWSQKKDDLNRLVTTSIFTISDILERNATTEEKKKGYDIADYLLIDRMAGVY